MGLENMFGGLKEMSTPALVVLVVLAAVGVLCLALYLRSRKNKQQDAVSARQWNIREIAIAALCVSLSFVLGFIKIFPMPMGGAITPASMLPIMAFAYIYGVKKGLLAGLVFSCLQLVQDQYIISIPQLLLDYTLAFSLLGLAGLAKKNILPGIALGCLARFACQFTSGIVFFGMFAPEGMPVWLYSLAYSGSLVGVECAICMAVSAIPAMAKMLNSNKAKNIAVHTAAMQKTA